MSNTPTPTPSGSLSLGRDVAVLRDREGYQAFLSFLPILKAPERLSRVSLFGAMLFAALLTFSVLSGCSGEDSALETTYAQASAGKGPPAAAATLRAQFYARQITAVGALNLAHDRLEKNNDGAALDFAEAVLMFLAQVEPDIDREKEGGGVNELFWIRIGTLAANAAAKARTGDDPTLASARARTLVLAGPERWQTDAYWQQNPAHDALVSMLMYENGEGKEAVARLKDRPQLADEPAAALAEIEKGMKRGGGRK